MAKRKSVKTPIDTENLIDLKIAEHRLECEEKFTRIDDKLTKVHSTLNEIANVKVNGTIGITQVLHDLYVATAELRSNYEMGSSFKRWLAQHKATKYFISSNVGKIIIVSVAIFIVLSVLNAIGVSIDPIQIFKNIFKSIAKLI